MGKLLFKLSDIFVPDWDTLTQDLMGDDIFTALHYCHHFYLRITLMIIVDDPSLT